MKDLNNYLSDIKEAKMSKDYQDVIDDAEAAIWSIDNEVKSWIPTDPKRKEKMKAGFQKKIDDAKKKMEKLDEAMVQVKGKDKPSGAFVLAKVILEELETKGMIKISNTKEKNKVIEVIQDVIMDSTF